MSLKPVEPTFEGGKDFNFKAAREAYDLVMKMDAETARVYTTMVVSDVVEATIEEHLPELQRTLDGVVTKRLQAVQKSMLKTGFSKSASTVLPYAKAWSEISKATPYDYGYRFQESDFNRDPRSGRFRMKVQHKQTAPLSDKHARAVIGTKNPQGLKGKKLAQFQDEYRQVAQFLDAVNASVGTGNAQTILHLQDKSGERYAEAVTNKREMKAFAADPDVKILGVEARPTTLTVGGAAFGLSNALGKPISSGGVSGINAVNDGLGDFAQSWTQETNHKNRNEKVYNRIESGSRYVGQIAPAGSKAQMAAAFGQFVGSAGPQAEMVIGPTARKTAYRYRGTERTPDSRLVNAYASAIQTAKMRSTHLPGRGATAAAPVQQAAQRISAERRDPTWEERNAGRAVVTTYLKGNLPSTKLSELQLASGNTPPSEGVIINAKGQIASQAVGYGDDHYLPFDLKNLKALKGGEYIRTRSYGGLTAEDIYAGLATGARQVTVVSHSGVFTVEFKPDFRGGRRHNDKARRMTRRYEQILDAVQSEQVDRKGIDPLIRQQIVAQVKADYPGEDAKTVREITNKKIEEYKENPELTPEDEALIEQLTVAARISDPSIDADDFRRQQMNEVMANKATRFRLDGPGYKAAADALAEQFPYYIEARSFPENEKDLTDLSLDRGYVEPGRNRPTAAAAGLFGAKNLNRYHGGTKFSASEADYQGYRGKGPAGSRTAAPEAAGEESESGAKKVLPQDKAKEIIAKEKFVSAAVELHRELKKPGTLTVNPGQEGFAPLSVSEDEFETWVRKPDNAAKFSAMVGVIEPMKDKLPFESARNATDAYKRASGGAEARKYEPALGLQAKDKPWTFEEAAYKTGAGLEVKQAEVRRINRRTKSVLTGRNLSSLSDDELKNEVKALAEVYRVVQNNPELQDRSPEGAEARKDIARELLKGYDANAVDLLLENPKKLEQRMEDVHRMRALMANGDFPQEERGNFTAREVKVDRPNRDAETPNPQAQVLKQIEHLKRQKVLYDVTMKPEQAGEINRLIAEGNGLLGDWDNVSDNEVMEFMHNARQHIPTS